MPSAEDSQLPLAGLGELGEPGEQDEKGPAGRSAAARGGIPPGPARRGSLPDGSAAEDPVALVVIDSPLAHLDRPFEYSVPADLADQARPGVRVRVRFAGRQVDGYLLARQAGAEHTGRLAALLRVVSSVPVLTPHLARLGRELADHYAGTLSDVLRLAIPPRHARAERSVGHDPDGGSPSTSPTPDGPTPDGVVPDWAVRAWADYPAGPALLRRLAAGEGPAAAWTAVPDAGSPQGWPSAVAGAVAAALASGRGSIVVVPDHRDVARVAAVLEERLGPEPVIRLTADLGPEQRYRSWLRLLHGGARVVVGSRSAAFAPVQDLGLVVWWDDGDDNLQEPRAPYPHVREVLRRRAVLTGAGLLTGGLTRSVQVQDWVAQGVCREVLAAPAARSAVAPRVTVAGEGHAGRSDPAAAGARVPTVAWRAVKDGLSRGPVLLQVPRRGYLLSLTCHHCRSPVRCATCAGPVQQAGARQGAACGWCGRADDATPCRECGDRRRRSAVVGQERTAEEIGRAFPGTQIISSRQGHVLDSVPDAPAIVLATPGAEPVAETGYAAVLLLDGWALLDRGGLEGGTEALRRWMAAAALARAGAAVVLAGVPTHAGLRPVEALVRWDGRWLADRELAERRELALPPTRRTATITGPADIVAELPAQLADEGALEVWGPLPLARPAPGVGRARSADGDPGPAGAAPGPEASAARLVLRAASPTGEDLLPQVVRELRAGRSLRKEAGTLQIRLDPADLEA